MSSRNKSLTDRKKSKSQQKTAVSQRKNSENEDYNFYQEFQQFSTEYKKVEFTKFEYMKEFFNLGISEFPTDEEIAQIQNDILTTSGWNSNLKKNWTLNEKKVLIWLIGKLSQIRGEDIRDLSIEFYQEVSSMLCRRDKDQCKQKWAQMQKIALQQQPFRPEEDKKLFEIIMQYQSADMGQKWSSIAQELNQSSNVYRSSKQCRERWLNHLNPKISKDPWTDAEDIELLTLVKEHGRRWAEISKMMDGRRSENNLKNRFNSLIKREKDLPVIQNGSATNLDDLLSGCTGPEISDMQKQAIDVLLSKLRWRNTQSQPKKVDRRESIQLVDNQVRRQSYQRNQTTTVTYTVGNIEQEQILNDLTPCLVNVGKNIIYFCTQDVFASFFQFQQQYKDQFEKIKSELSIFDAGFQQFKSTLSMIEEIEESQKSRSIIQHQNIITNDLDDYFNLETPETFSRPVYVAPLDLIAKSALKKRVSQLNKVELTHTEIASEFDINLIMKKTLFIMILLSIPMFVFNWNDYETLQFLQRIHHIGIQKLDQLLDSFISSTHKVQPLKQQPKKAQNFANYYGGAVILSQSDSLHQIDNILIDSVEAYMITECVHRDVFFVISLKEEIQLERIYFINKELYSSTIRNFQVIHPLSKVFGSVIYPTNEWELLGKFEAEDTNDWQSFQFESHFLRYLKILIVDFHQAEYHCTLTQIRYYYIYERVQGQTVIGDLLDSYKRDKAFSPKDSQPQKLETTSVKITFNEILVDEERNDTCSFLDYFYHQPKNIANQFINVLPYKTKQSLLKVTAQNILILSHNVELIKQHIIELKDQTFEQKNILEAEEEKQRTIETIQQQLILQLQQQQMINQNLESQMQQIRYIIIIVLFALSIMSIVMAMLCATRQPQTRKINKDKCQSALVPSNSGLLSDESLATPISKNGKQKKKKNN